MGQLVLDRGGQELLVVAAELVPQRLELGVSPMYMRVPWFSMRPEDCRSSRENMFSRVRTCLAARQSSSTADDRAQIAETVAQVTATLDVSTLRSTLRPGR